MSFLSGLSKLVSPLAKAGGALMHTPLVGTAIKALPVVGTVATIGSAAYDIFGNRGGGSPSGGLPALPAPGTNSPGILPRGPGGSLQMPWNDASPGAQAKPFSLDDRYLKQIFRSPKGYVTMWDGGRRGVGRPFPVLKTQAKHLHYADGSPVYRPHKKPPITVGEHSALKKAARVVRKVHAHHKLVAYVHSNTNAHGAVTVHKHHKKGSHK